MQASLIEVECRSESRDDESPSRAYVRGRWVDIEEILDRWCHGERAVGPADMEFFKVVAEDGGEYLLKHDRALDLWFMEGQW